MAVQAIRDADGNVKVAAVMAKKKVGADEARALLRSDAAPARGARHVNRLERLMHVATKYSRRIIGIMSGTSLDAIDVAMVRIEKHGLTAKVKLRALPRVSVSAEDPRRRARAVRPQDAPASTTSAATTSFSARSLRRRCCACSRRPGSRRTSVDLIASAGQTIWHDPELSVIEPDVDWIEGPLETRSTFAIGQSAVIAERTGIITVGDLRVRDVAAGGQGAPLVPYFDWVLLRHKSRGRCIQNIGGIGNVTYIPPKANWEDVIAFDTGPGNMIIDELAWIATNGAADVRRRRCPRRGGPGATRSAGALDGRSLFRQIAAEDDGPRAVRRAVRERGSSRSPRTSTSTTSSPPPPR